MVPTFSSFSLESYVLDIFFFAAHVRQDAVTEHHCRQEKTELEVSAAHRDDGALVLQRQGQGTGVWTGGLRGVDGVHLQNSRAE